MADETPTTSNSTLDCGADPIASMKTMFVDITMGQRLAGGQNPARRPVFLKPHGVARAEFQILSGLPQELRVGIFAEPRSYAAWIRISSDTIPALPDLKTTVGFGIKLFDFGGDRLIGNPADKTFDLILQNHDVFFVDTAADMCAFTKASFEGHFDEYLAGHPATAAILEDMKKQVTSVFESPYWSVLPYAFGPRRFVKYKLEPDAAPAAGGLPDFDDPTYLATDLRDSLMKGKVRFRFLVQFQTTETDMPLDRATVRWSENASAPIHVATLVIPRQDVTARGQAAYGDNLAMNPWRVSQEHAPVGSIALARKVIYAASADLRRAVNGVPDGEPLHPRDLAVFPSARDTEIVSARIHPAIGIARVGNAESSYFFGPEIPYPLPAAAGGRRDETGALKRQAARFRIYGYNRAGEAVAELTSDRARTEWTIQLANLKASWYQFQIALDIPEAASAEPSARRNKDVADRSTLAITSPLLTFSGAAVPSLALEGTFNQQTVYLGEAKTDESGRLIVLGGRGKTGSLPGASITGFANNDGWHDDVSDGPVTATVSIDGKDIPVDPAWVVVAPPNYAPDLKGVRTMYDLLRDVFIDAGSLPMPETISFTHDILPVFERLAGLQWVNAGYASAFGHGGTLDLLSPNLIAKLGDPSPANRAFRYEIFNSFRDFDKDSWSPDCWPWLYGDAIDIPFAHTPRQNTMLAKHQLLGLRRWAEGTFVSDYPAARETWTSIEDVPLSRQPETLDRAALEFCLADAFHPGCEMTWPVRHASLYMAPFRIRHRRADERVMPTGDILTSEEALAFDGVLYGQKAGWITRWLAVPWHTDTASCRSQGSYDPTYSPFVPTFWPARVPNHILSEEDYKTATDTTKPRDQRVAAFRNRIDWFDQELGDPPARQIQRMLSRYGNMSLIEARQGVDGDPDIPSAIYVGDGKPMVAGEGIPLAAGAAPAEPAVAFTERLGNFPFGPRE